MKQAKIGEMDSIITIQQPTTSRDPNTNEQIITWSTFNQVWAKKEFAAESEESEESAQIRAKNRVKYTCNFFGAGAASTLNEKMRIVDGGKYYSIYVIREIGRNNQIEIEAEHIADTDNQ